VGLHAHPGRAEESESSRGTVDHRHDPQGARDPAERPTSWQAFLRAHWKAVVAADFFTTEVWTVRGLVNYYTLFVIELHSRRVSIVGSTPHPDEAFVRQVIRQLTAADEGVLDGHRVLICDRDRKWSLAVRELLETSGVRVIQTPFRAPNCNAHAERFVRSVKEECLDRLIPLGERHFGRALADFVVHYHRERNHQGLDNQVIDGLEVLPSERPRAAPSAGGWSPQLLLSGRVVQRPKVPGGIVGHYGVA
jgi:putative transposase